MKISIDLKNKFKLLFFINISNKALIKINKSGMLKMYDALLNINEDNADSIEKIKIVTAFKEIFSILKNFLTSKINKDMINKLINDMKIRP